MTRLTEDESTPAQELEDVVAGAEDLALEALTAAHEVSDPLFGRRRDANGGEFTDSVEPSQLGGIVAIELASFAGPGGNEGGGNDITVDAPGGDLTVEYVAGSTGFVARAHLSPLCPPGEEPPELAEVVGEMLEDFGFGGVIDKDGHHNGVLVDIHPDMNDRARHGAGPPIGCDLERRMWHWRETRWGCVNPRYPDQVGPALS
jgi:hypothetical protein